ncbi:hypothetical protein FSP39_019552 [Pinctada imbricata]|uniref:B box-type domain-containing protein n=1 Tax=Pinctada imbricata TaxID=66713 RepID=A0AA88YHG3_PINIB|nr:hypothetical protein FSP39_019552 [Pinctada imbricata]
MAFASSRIDAQEAIIKPCDLCEDDEDVNWFCKDCHQNLCDKCKRTHLRSTVSKSHDLISIAEGLTIGRRSMTYICNDHGDIFQFFCQTCDRNICSRCLFMEHKKHDFIDLRELQTQVKKQVEEIVREKEEERNKMTSNYDELVQSEKESETYLKVQCANIDDRVKVIQCKADEEGEMLKASLSSAMEEQNKEIKDGKTKLQANIRDYDEEIQNVRQELRLQLTSSLNSFVKETTFKLKALRSISISTPSMSRLFVEGTSDKTHIREMIGNIGTPTKGAGIEGITEKEEIQRPCRVLSAQDFVKAVKLNRLEYCASICLSKDGSIWIGGLGFVYKVSADLSTVHHGISNLFVSSCRYIACLQSGDAVVSYGESMVDKFTSDGRRVEFTDLTPRMGTDIAVTNHDLVAINVDRESLVIFSNEGQRLKEIKVDGGIKAFCADREGNFIIAQRNSSTLTLLDGRNGIIKTTWTWHLSPSDISRFTCDRHGNVLVTNRKKNIYFFDKNGEAKDTFTVEKGTIIGICSNQKDHLLILISDTNNTEKLLVAKYLR